MGNICLSPREGMHRTRAVILAKTGSMIDPSTAQIGCGDFSYDNSDNAGLKSIQTSRPDLQQPIETYLRNLNNTNSNRMLDGYMHIIVYYVKKTNIPHGIILLAHRTISNAISDGNITSARENATVQIANVVGNFTSRITNKSLPYSLNTADTIMPERPQLTVKDEKKLISEENQSKEEDMFPT